MERVGSLGATMVFVGLSAPVSMVAPAGALGGWIQQASAGTLWLGMGLSQIPGSSNMMWINTGTVPFSFDGPAKFFLYATGATVSAGIGWQYSVVGISSPIVGG